MFFKIVAWKYFWKRNWWHHYDRIEIFWNRLTTLSRNIFKNQTNLQTLYISYSSLETLSENIFQNQTNLQTLVLKWNEFCNCLFSEDEKSILSDCSNSNLSSVPSELGNELHQIPALKEIELNISSNGIVNLPNSTVNGFERNENIETVAVLEGNSWTCDDLFSYFILFNEKIVDYEQIVCKDGEPLFQKHNRFFG